MLSKVVDARIFFFQNLDLSSRNAGLIVARLNTVLIVFGCAAPTAAAAPNALLARTCTHTHAHGFLRTLHAL